jgi:condensation enzyme
MTDAQVPHGEELKRYPLSFTQELFLKLDSNKDDDTGPLGGRFLIVSGLRITGHVDLAALQGGLDDVVERHELLRTRLVKDADPPYQLVCPPCQVPLQVRDLPSVTENARDLAIQKLLLEVSADTMSTHEMPLLRALLCRFDDRDSVLFLTAHHSAVDGWSAGVILRDLGALYAARVSGTPPVLPPMRQYREFVEWQRTGAGGTSDDGALKYWAEKLGGGLEFRIPNDHGRPDRYSRPFSLHVFGIEADTMAAAGDLATAIRGTLFMVMLSAIYVLANQLTGATDVSINVMTADRSEFQFHNTMGSFLAVVPFRTEIADCTSFRDIVMKTRETFIEAMTHALPVEMIAPTIPDYISPRQDKRRSALVVVQPPFAGSHAPLPIAEGARLLGELLLEETESTALPGGTAWHLSRRPDGSMGGATQFNLDEFEASTVQKWAAGLERILTSAVRHPDQDWRQL